MATNDKTGLEGQSAEQLEVEVRTLNPFMDDIDIQKVIARLTSRDASIERTQDSLL